MVANFFYNRADKKQVGKDAKSGGNYIYLTPKAINGATDITINYKDDTDLINPVFTFAANKRIQNNINYLFVQEMHRWYYVDDITYSQHMIELHCTVDVLTSFAAEIKEQYAIVIRQQENYNMYLTDDKIRTDAQSRILTYPFRGGFGTTLQSGTVKNCSYIFAINGGGDST
ncbi:MAG: hypothetical protein IKS48_06085 [Eubacterium sp.]|nr:hypothetical protein [Eubacterium sp.]